MTFYQDLKLKFEDIINEHGVKKENVIIKTKALSTEEAIGNTKRKDFPIIKGKEVLVEADFKGYKGQAYTDTPSEFSGKLEDILKLDLNNSENISLFIATINAVLKNLGLIDKTVHCKNEEPEKCAKELKEYFKENYKNTKIALVGMQPAMLDYLKDDFEIRVLDLDSNNIGKNKYGVIIEDGINDQKKVLNWADVILVTGSTVSNGSVKDFTELKKPVYFYGTSIAGAAYLKNLKRLCFFAK